MLNKSYLNNVLLGFILFLFILFNIDILNKTFYLYLISIVSVFFFPINYMFYDNEKNDNISDVIICFSLICSYLSIEFNHTLSIKIFSLILLLINIGSIIYFLTKEKRHRVLSHVITQIILVFSYHWSCDRFIHLDNRM